MSAYLIKHSYVTHMVEDDLESSLYVILWTALTMYKETFVHRSKFITEVFETIPGSFSKAHWLIVRAKLPRVMFVDCKLLDSLIHTLTKFFSHRYTQISDHERTTFDERQLALATIEQSLTQSSAANERLLKAARGLVVTFPVHQKEMGLALARCCDTYFERAP